MRFVRYRCGPEGLARWGCLGEDGESITAISAAPWTSWTDHTETTRLSEVTLLAPWEGGTLHALALNYPGIEGATMDGDFEPLLFLKGPNTVLDPGRSLPIPSAISFTHMWIEVELAVVIGRPCVKATREEAAAAILGYTIANDVTVNNALGRDHHLARAKSLDHFCPLGPWIDTDLDPATAVLTSRINGETVQRGAASERFWDDAACVHQLSQFISLRPGDFVLTGTPAGAGPGNATGVVRGDRVDLEISGLGRLVHDVG